MVLQVILFIVGIALMFKGSDYLVEASVAIGRRARLPNVVVGGTIVSIATTSPELTVSIISGLEKTPGLAIGNALGSAAFNMGFILGFAALVRPFELLGGELRWRSVIILGLTALLFFLTIDDSLTLWRGILLITIGMVYLFFDYRRGAARYAQQGEAIGGRAVSVIQTTKRLVLFFVTGSAMVIGGSVLVVNSGTDIAEALGVPPLIIGLTMLSVGTSLPELATAIAAIRKHAFDLSVGNLIGANALNLTIVTGTAASIYPLSMARETQIYMFPAIFVIFSVFFLLVRTKNRLSRWEGAIIISLYVAFIGGLSAFDLV